MFTTFANVAIDSIQSAKKIAVDTLVKHDGLASALNQFVDAQTEYTKKAVETSVTAATSVYSAVSDKNFISDYSKGIQSNLSTWFSFPKK